MKRCLELAALGIGSVAPNPMVGAVIVHDNKIIGEGFHRMFGGHHAEVNAVNSVENMHSLAYSTIYVNLEPCAHHGKTPPCADLIIKHKFKTVVVCNSDPNIEVAGKGIQRMKEAGIEVITGVLEPEGRWLNRRFFTFHEKKRPFFILKWAQTSDGFIDGVRQPGDTEPPLKITCDQANTLVHKWRTEDQAILVGRNTALMDDPQLTARKWKGKNPLRLVIDPQSQLPASLRMFNDEHPTWVYTAKASIEKGKTSFHRINDASEYLHEIATDLHASGIQSVIIEGGKNTIERFYEKGLWDEARVFTGLNRIGEGLGAPKIKGVELSRHQIGDDLLQIISPE